jgi:hypothetical protein
MLKAPGIKRSRLLCDDPLSNVAFKFNLRRYILLTAPECASMRKQLNGSGAAAAAAAGGAAAGAYTRSRFSST